MPVFVTKIQTSRLSQVEGCVIKRGYLWALPVVSAGLEVETRHSRARLDG